VSLPASDLHEAVPIVVMMNAVQRDNFHKFLSAWSFETLKKRNWQTKDWPGLRKKWMKRLDGDLGKFWFNDLRFMLGEESVERSVVYIMQKDKRKTRFYVSRKDGSWKLVE